MISESKLDGTFPSSQFQICGFRTPYIRDRNDRGGGILLFERENLIKILLPRHSSTHDIEILLIKLNIRKKEFCCCYNTGQQRICPRYIQSLS